MDLPCPIPVLPILVKPLYLTNSCQTLDPATIVHDSSHLTHVPASVKTRLPEHSHLVPGHVKLQRKKHRLSLPHSKTLFLLYRLHKAGQSVFPFLFHSRSCSVTFKRLDNPSFHSCSILALALSPSKRLDNPSFHSCSIPALAPLPSKGWTTLISILAPFPFLPCRLHKKAGQPFFSFLFFFPLFPCRFKNNGQPLFSFLFHSLFSFF